MNQMYIKTGKWGRKKLIFFSGKSWKRCTFGTSGRKVGEKWAKMRQFIAELGHKGNVKPQNGCTYELISILINLTECPAILRMYECTCLFGQIYIVHPKSYRGREKCKFN